MEKETIWYNGPHWKTVIHFDEKRFNLHGSESWCGKSGNLKNFFIPSRRENSRSWYVVHCAISYKGIVNFILGEGNIDSEF